MSTTTVRMRLGLGSHVRLVFRTLLLGGLVGGIATVGLVTAWLNELARELTPDFPYADPIVRESWLSTALPLLLLACVVLPLICLRLRIGGRARITLDEKGITEWVGTSARTFIPRAAMRVASEVRGSKSIRFGEVVYLAITQVSDAEGRRITVVARDPLGAMLPSRLPLWARRRATLAEVDQVLALNRALPAPTEGLAIEPDPRDARRPLEGASAFLLAVTLACAIGAPLTMIEARSASEEVGAMFALLAVLLIVALVRPVAELRALRREQRALAGARAVSFVVGSDGTTLVALDDGRTLPADVSAVRHPDARVTSRAEPVRALVDVQGGGDAYRGAPAQACIRTVETSAERAERRSLIVADAIEIFTRAVHAALVATLAVLIMTRIVTF